jgi:signal transduction histidine kinase
VTDLTELERRVARLEQRATRAKEAREEAERLLEVKSRELYLANCSLERRNAEMRLILDTVQQGFLVIDAHGTIRTEFSRIVQQWFDVVESGTRFSALLGRIDPELGAHFELGWEALREDILPRELCYAQLPQRFIHRGRQFTLAWYPTDMQAELGDTLVVVSDCTEEIERMRSDQRQRETLALIMHLREDASGLAGFASEVDRLVAQCTSGASIEDAKRCLHTLKGITAIFGVRSFSELCHELEDDLAEQGEFSASAAMQLRAAHGELSALFSLLLGRDEEGQLLLHPGDVSGLVRALVEGRSRLDILGLLAYWKGEPVSAALRRTGKYAEALAERLGKAGLCVVIDAHELRVDGARWEPFFSSLVHLARNAVDHGVETPEEREAAGKPRAGKLTLSAVQLGDCFVVSVEDDGRGVAWDKVRARARELALPCTSESELLDALFSDRLSTRNEVSTTSGRGVGLSCVRDAVGELGGHLRVETEPGKYTRFVCVFAGTKADAQPSEESIRRLELACGVPMPTSLERIAKVSLPAPPGTRASTPASAAHSLNPSRT